MRLGFVIPQIGPRAGPDSLTRVATRAEDIGFDGLSATERGCSFPSSRQRPIPSGTGALAFGWQTHLSSDAEKL
jgi:hypothetical protein